MLVLGISLILIGLLIVALCVRLTLRLRNRTHPIGTDLEDLFLVIRIEGADNSSAVLKLTGQKDPNFVARGVSSPIGNLLISRSIFEQGALIHYGDGCAMIRAESSRKLHIGDRTYHLFLTHDADKAEKHARSF